MNERMSEYPFKREWTKSRPFRNRPV